MLIWWAASMAAEPCPTLALLADAPPVRRGVVAAAGPEKGTRDMYAAPYEQQSDNFVLRWGQNESFTDEERSGLLNAMELAWQVEIEEMGHPAPYGSDAFKFNVYIGGTGGGLPPDISGVAGYYKTDGDGWPMIVMAPVAVRDLLVAEATAVHEMYHAIQDSLDRYTYQDLSAWYWEATAEWVTMQVLPGNTFSGQFAFGYLMLPDLPVNFFGDREEDSLEKYHQYGAFLFPHFLTDRLGSGLVRDSWLSPEGGDDPLETLRALVAEQGEDLDELWLDHIAHNAVLDYPFGGRLERQLELAAATWPDAGLYRGTVTPNGESRTVDGKDAPGRYGAYVLRMPEAYPGSVQIGITGHEAGTRGSPAHFGARLIEFDEDGVPQYTPIPFDGLHGEISLPDGLPTQGVYVVVGAWSRETSAWDKERFPFDWTIEIVPPPDEDTRACGCAASGYPGLWLLLPFWRRRTRVRST